MKTQSPNTSLHDKYQLIRQLRADFGSQENEKRILNSSNSIIRWLF